MSITLEQAKGLRLGDILYSTVHTNADGTPQRWRVNGKVKTWKRDSSRVYVPLKHGLYTYDHLSETSLDLVCLDEDEAQALVNEYWDRLNQSCSKQS